MPLSTPSKVLLLTLPIAQFLSRRVRQYLATICPGGRTSSLGNFRFCALILLSIIVILLFSLYIIDGDDIYVDQAEPDSLGGEFQIHLLLDHLCLHRHLVNQPDDLDP